MMNTTTVNGQTYVHIEARCKTLRRVLLGPTKDKAKIETLFKLVKKLREARHAKFTQLIEEAGASLAGSARTTAKKRRYTIRGVEDKVLTIAETAVVSFWNTSCDIVCNKPSKSKLLLICETATFEKLQHLLTTFDFSGAAPEADSPWRECWP